MKITVLILATISALSTFSCKKDDGAGCMSCASAETSSFEVCEEGNGNASINGQDTGTSYADYILALEKAGAKCGN